MTAATHTYNLGAQRFADLVKERTGGRVSITIYPDGQLGKGERELLEAIQQGTIDIYVGSTGPLGGFNPAMQILDIPFLFRDYAHVDMVLDGPIGQELLSGLESSGMKGLAFWENGFRNLTNSRGPVTTPADAQGLKIRTMENAIHLAAWKAAGLNPTPMAWGEVYGALQQKVIDGQENPVVVILTSKIYEVQKYMTLTRHVYSPAVIIVSQQLWSHLPDVAKEVFLSTAREVAQYQRNLGREAEQNNIAALEAQGMNIVKAVDSSAWQAAMQSAFNEFYKQFGKEKIDAIINTR
jgi:tripartite ATP-independent transporter DctP family solute receptor